MALFHFLVPLRSQATAADHWFANDNPDGRSVEAATQRCLASLLNQSERSIAVHLACHEVPPLAFDDERLKVHQVDFPRPADIDLATYNRLSGKTLSALPGIVRQRVGDKYSKVKVAYAAALQDPESAFVMLVDSDDLIHRDVVAHALTNAQRPECAGGHTVTSGYSWRVGAEGMRKLNSFHKICGSCNVVRLMSYEKENFAKTGDVNKLHPDRKAYWLYAGHASVFARLRKEGRMTEKIPFRAAVYVNGTGANISGSQGSKKGDILLTDELKAEFGL